MATTILVPKSANQLVADRYNDIKDSWEKRERRYIQNYRQLLARTQPGPYNSKIATKYTHTQIMVWNAFALMGLFPSTPWLYPDVEAPFDSYPALNEAGESAPIDVESAAAQEINARLKTLSFYRRMYLWLDLSSKFGLGVMKQTWNNGISWQLTNPGNIAWDPTCEDLRFDAEWVIEKHDRLTVGQAKRLAEAGVFKMDALKVVLESVAACDGQREKTQEVRSGDSRPVGVDDDRRLTLHDMVTPDRIITVHIDSETVLRDAGNPYGYIYYYDMTPFPEPFEVQGYSIPEMLEGIQREINTWRQQRTDIRSLCANPQINIRRRSGINIRGQRSRPGKIWPVNEHDDVMPWQFQDKGMSLLQEEGVFTGDGDRLLGIMAHTRGERGEEMKATVANMIQGNVGTRFAVTMKRVEDYPIRPMMQDLVKIWSQYEEPVSIDRAKWRLVKEAAQKRKLSLNLHTDSHVGNAMGKVQSYGQFLAMSVQDLKPEGRAEILREMLKLMQFPRPDKVLRHIIPFELKMQMEAGGSPQGRSKVDQGQGVPLTSEMARAGAPGQASSELAGIPV